MSPLDPGARRRLTAAALLSLACVGASSGAALAAGEEPVTVRADQVEYFDALNKVVASGHVEAIYRDAKVTCEQATIYMTTKDAYLRGRVHLFQLDGLLKGEEILYNFRTRKGTVLSGEGQAGPWFSKGDRAEKFAPDGFVHRAGYLTSCDFEKPHTRLQAREVRVYLDDRVVLRNAVMYVGDMPVLYLPSYTHPLDDKRPRVTIIPGKDKQWGLFLLTAWRVYIHENLQGRFHVDYRERLDLATGIDLKYTLPFGGKGLFREYYTLERSLAREHFYSRFFSPDDDQPSKERERYRFQLRHVWQMDRDTRATLEYNHAKDANVVQDFFLREMEENRSIPESYLQIIRGGPWYGLTFLMRKRVNRYETVTQQLPFIHFDIRPMELPWLPSLRPRAEEAGRLPSELRGESRRGWYYRSSFTYEHSNVGAPRDGTKESLLTLKTEQEIFHPLRLFRWLNLRPFFRFRQSSFSRGAKETAPQFRQQAGAGFDLSTKFFRVFDAQTDFLGLDLNRARHVVTPTLTYEYQAKPTLSADRLLRSDGRAKSHTLTPGIENKLQTKRLLGGSWTTVDLARFLVSTPYDIEGSAGRGGEWGNWTADLEMLPYPWLRVESDAAWDPHIRKFTTINADLVAHPELNKGMAGPRVGEYLSSDEKESNEVPWAVGLGWRYQRNTSAQLTFETEFNLGRKWRAGLYQALDVKRFITETSPTESRTVKKVYAVPEYEYRLRRDLHEWTVELIYNVRRQQGETVLILFRLKAAPELPLEFKRNYHQPKAGRNFAVGGSAAP